MLGRVLAEVSKSIFRSRPEPTPSGIQDFAHIHDCCIPLGGDKWLVRGRHGIFLVNRNDIYLGRALLLYGEYGQLEYEALESMIKPGDTVVEVGANIGSLTVPLAKAVGLNGAVYAIEPQRGVFHTLCANLALNDLSNVQAIEAGCGATKETMYVPDSVSTSAPYNSGGVSLSSVQSSGYSVPVVPLDDVLVNSDRVDLLKIDVEGMEIEVLKGAERTLARFRPPLLLENDRVSKSQALIEWLQAHDYRMWWHLPRLYNPNNFFTNTENCYANIVSVNMLCLPRESAIPIPFDLEEVVDASFHIMR